MGYWSQDYDNSFPLFIFALTQKGCAHFYHLYVILHVANRFYMMVYDS